MTEREKCNLLKREIPSRKEMMTKSVGELADQLGIKVGCGSIVQRDQGSMGKHNDKEQ